ncbi:MAG: restriction endonuclease, partial [Arcobacteraceae bacterium]
MENIIYEYNEVKNDKLTQHIINTSALHTFFKLEWKTLKAQQYCGILNFDKQDYYILPKIANHSDEQ